MNFTTINPPSGFEGDTVDIITNMFPDFIRLSDDADQILLNGEYIIAFEDNPNGDFDFNDWIGHVTLENGVLVNTNFVGSWASASQNISYFEGIFRDTTNLGVSSSLQSENPHGQDMMVTYGRESQTTIPEPSTMLLLGISLAVVAIFRKI